jgi:hypothetical protein
MGSQGLEVEVVGRRRRMSGEEGEEDEELSSLPRNTALYVGDLHPRVSLMDSLARPRNSGQR